MIRRHCSRGLVLHPAPARRARGVHEDQRVPDALTHLLEGAGDLDLVRDVAAHDAGSWADVEAHDRVAAAAQALHDRRADRPRTPDHHCRRPGRLAARRQWGTFGVSGSASHSVQEPSYTAMSSKPARR